MKTTLLLFFTLISFGLSSQETYELNWANGGSSDSQQITIEVGDTVKWIWVGNNHNLLKTSGPETGFGVDSDLYNEPHDYSYTFTTVGVNTYHCSPHSSLMNGTVTVNSSTAGISENKLLSFEMYPNPVSDVLNIQLPSGTDKAEVGVYDYTGRLVSSKTISSNDSTLDIQKISKGIYIIRVTTNNKIGVQRFIKK